MVHVLQVGARGGGTHTSCFPLVMCFFYFLNLHFPLEWFNPPPALIEKEKVFSFLGMLQSGGRGGGYDIFLHLRIIVTANIMFMFEIVSILV